MSINLNLSDYYSKISEIRNKILSKHKPPHHQQNHSISDISFNQNLNTPINHDRRNIIKAPLEDIGGQQKIINCRVKQLDDINGKIKNVLAERRFNQKENQESPKRLRFYQNQISIPLSNTEHVLKRNDSYRQKLASFGFEKQENSYNFHEKARQKFVSKYESPSKYKNFSSTSQQCKKQLFFEEKTFDRSNKLSQKQNLVNLLLSQVQLDMKLRQLKQQFSYYQNQQKLTLILSLFEKRGIQMKNNQIQTWIHLSPQERNPFFNVTGLNSFDFQGLVARSLQAKQHWEKKFKETISIRSLQYQNFTIGEIDVDGKGYFSIQNLVCFLNINSESCLRNRDVFSMFKRLKDLEGQVNNENKLSYEAFLNYITK